MYGQSSILRTEDEGGRIHTGLFGASYIKLYMMNTEQRDSWPYKMFHHLFFLKSKIDVVKHVCVITRVTSFTCIQFPHHVPVTGSC